MIKYLRILACVAAAIAVTACGVSGNDEPDIPPTPVNPDPVNTTVLVYMAASNSLGVQKNDSMDIREMQEAARAGHFNGNRLLVYHAGYQTPQTLSEITSDGKIVRLKEYSDDGLTSIHSARMKKVIADAKTTAPSNKFGLILWSHGDGWLQNGIDDKTLETNPSANNGFVHKPLAYGWGEENSRKMKITTLARTLEQVGQLDFVYFDCCYMASVEVAYEMRKATPYIVGSVIELPAEGMPYNKTLQYLFKTSGPDLVAAATTTFDHFDQMRGEDRTCAMSVIRTAGLENLAKKTLEVYQSGIFNSYNGYEPQPFMTSANCYFFDLADYVQKFADFRAPQLKEEWQKAFDDTVIFSRATPYIWNRVSLDRCNGLSTFLLNDEQTAINSLYYTLSWYADVANRLIPPEVD